MSQPENPLRLEYLLEATRNLRTAADVEAYLQLLVDTVSELTRSEASSLLVPEPGTGMLHFLAMPVSHAAALKPLDVPIRASIAGRVFQQGRPEIVNRVVREADHYKGAELATGIVTRAMLAVPVIFKGERLGVLQSINRLDGEDYTEEDVAIVEILASVAALLLYNQRLERDLEKSAQEIAMLDRMKSDFIAITSHELRTPLGLILGHSTFLREYVDEEHHPQLDVVIRSATRLKDIIESLSNVDNIQSGMASLRAHRISPKRLAQELVQDFQQEAGEKNISLTLRAPAADPMLEGDPEKIAIALSNLIKNAIMFTNNNGHVFVDVEPMPGYIKFSVIDDGIGIPPSDLPRIFDRFYQVESHLTRKHGGMGLGLSVAKMMVELHGGRIWAESVEGKGSQFVMMLPIDSSQATAAQKVFIE